LEAGEIDAAAAEELDVLAREVVADDADEADVPRQERRGDRDVARRAAEDVGPAAERPVEVVERHRADDEKPLFGHRYFPMMPARRWRASGVTWAGSVMSAPRAALGQRPSRGGRTRSAARRTMSRAVSTLRRRTASTASTVTACSETCQQS